MTGKFTDLSTDWILVCPKLSNVPLRACRASQKGLINIGLCCALVRLCLRLRSATRDSQDKCAYQLLHVFVVFS